MKFQRIIYSVVFYLLIMTLIYVTKPAIIFNSDGTLKDYGVEDGETIFSLGVICVVLAIISHYLFALIDFVFQAPPAQSETIA
jgi:hypothetical protein